MNFVYRLLTFITIFFILEFLANFLIFPLLNKFFEVGKGTEKVFEEPQIGPRLKGILERLL